MERVFITAGANTSHKLKCGECLLDHLPGTPEFIEHATVIYNQHTGQMHIQTEEQPRIPGKSYRLAIAHSDTCFSRKYGRLASEVRTYDRGLVKLASCLVV